METSYNHEPVLSDEVIEILSPFSGGKYCDATIGGGGHAEKLLEASSPDGFLLGIDKDPHAVVAARAHLARFGKRVTIMHGKFSELEMLLEKAGVPELDGFIVDLGVSSHQLDTAQRGFSFMKTGPLDMRMDTSEGETAAALLNQVSEDDLADILYHYGGERVSRRVARSIKKMVGQGTMNTTSDLAVAVKKVLGHAKIGKIDPATRTFQAVRIAVNDELKEIEKLMNILPGPLAKGGTVVIISFHSLEDKIVKKQFQVLAGACSCPPGMPVCNCPKASMRLVSRRAVKAGTSETRRNPRSRSARLRAAVRI